MSNIEFFTVLSLIVLVEIFKIFMRVQLRQLSLNSTDRDSTKLRAAKRKICVIKSYAFMAQGIILRYPITLWHSIPQNGTEI
jgi:hypothetical protein